MGTFNASILPSQTGLALGNPNQLWLADLSDAFLDTIVSNAYPQALAGFIRLASTDFIAWRNAANTGDVTLSKTGVAAGNVPADTLVFNGGGIEGPFISHNPNPATTGELRLAVGDVIAWRNNANTADAPTISVNSSDQVVISSLAPGNFGGILFADQFPGIDLGAKINAAFAQNSTNSEVWVNQAAGTIISTAVTVPAYCGIRFIQGGVYSLRAQITMSDSSWIEGLPAGINESISIGLLNPTVTLQQGAGVNLNPAILIAGQNVVLENFALDGNSANNTGNSVGISTDVSNVLPNSRGRLRMYRITAENFVLDNVQIISTSTNNQAESANIIECSLSNSLGGCGLRVERTSDWHLVDSRIESCGGWGIMSYASTGLVRDCDISNCNSGLIYIGSNSSSANLSGGNNSIIGCGLSGPSLPAGSAQANTTASVTSASVASGIATLIAANTFVTGNIVILKGFTASNNVWMNGKIMTIRSANATTFTVAAVGIANYGATADSGTGIMPGNAAIYIDGYDNINAAGNGAQGNRIFRNSFGFISSAQTNTFDAIHIQDSGSNQIANNIISSGAAAGYKDGISLTSVNATEQPDYIAGNGFFNVFGTSAMALLNTTFSFGNDVAGVFPAPTNIAPTGFGTGSSGTAVTTTTKGGGTGPTTPQTVTGYLNVKVAGADRWIPYMT